MRTAGMIGGLGPESTVDYYRLLIARYRARRPDAGYPHVIINSLDVDKGIALLDAGRLGDWPTILQPVCTCWCAPAWTLVSLRRTRRISYSTKSNAGRPSRFSASCAPLQIMQRRLCLKKMGLFEPGLLCGRAFTRRNSSGWGSPCFHQKESEREFIPQKIHR